jgi:hypothetical protein
MRKRILAALMGVLFLASCNLPLRTSAPPDENALATNVAQTLTAWPTLPSTRTPLPTLTLINATPTPTVKQTVLPTPTPAANDPVLTLGEPSFTDTFTSGSGFGLKTPYEDSAIQISVEDGSMVFRSLALQAGRRWRLTYPFAKDLYLEGTFTTVSCAGADYYGLMFRAPQYNDGIGYYVALSCKGQVAADWFDGSKSHTLLDWTFAPSALTGKGQTNRLGVMVVNNQISIYVNGVFVKSLTTDNLKEKGHFGVFVNAAETPNFTFKVDVIKEWDQP